MRIAFYLRLSSEDIDLKNSEKTESESISNQRRLLYDYVESHLPEYAGAEVIEFCDDGWSGKNFERPAVTDMLDKVRHGMFDCCLVKDFSRFGRDYLIVGNYISRVFPFLGVRFIAVNDGFDSNRPGDIDSLDTSFKTLIYDLYSRDLSVKVKAAKKQKASKGLFMSPFAPYGYIKDEKDKNRLVIDEDAAETVRNIFTLSSQGMSSAEIAASLNRRAVLTPMCYKRAAGCSRGYWPRIRDDNFWTDGAVLKILRDERYIGKNVYGKRERPEVGNRRTARKYRTDWVVTEDCHEPIVSPELFNAVQERMGEIIEKETVKQKDYPLRKKVRCGVCGYMMVRGFYKSAYFYCDTHKFDTYFQCPTGKIPESDIEETVLTVIRTYARLAVSLRELETVRTEKRRMTNKAAQKQLASYQVKYSRLEKQLQDLYENLVEGKLGKDTYLAQKQYLTEAMSELSEKITETEKLMRDEPSYEDEILSKFAGYAQVDALTSSMTKELLKMVWIHSNNVIEIRLNFQDELDAMAAREEQLMCVGADV